MGTIRIFRQYVATRFIVLATIEAFIFIFSLYFGLMAGLRVSWLELLDYINLLAPEAIFFATVMLISLSIVGLYQRRLKNGRVEMISRVVLGVGIGTILIHQISYTLPELDMGREAWLSVISIAFIGVLITRLLMFQALSSQALQRRVLVLGSGEKAASLKESASKFANGQFQIVEYVPLVDITKGVGSNLLLATESNLLEIAKRVKADEIVVAVDNKKESFPTNALLRCKLFGIEVNDIVTFYEREAGIIKIDWISPSWFIFADGFQRGKWRKRLKRYSDVVCSAGLLFLFWPIMLLVSFAIYVEDRGKGPLLYKQKRVGENGKIFELLKFRSMKVDAEKNGIPQWAQQNDNRITRVGHVIRRLRFDEFPQIINVFRGEMSFVGPRPERPEFVENLQKTIPYYQERHAVKPGITGWAQVCYPYGATEQDAFEKLQYDLYYVKNNSLFLDFVILLQTAEVVLLRRGSR
ncbi:TIGR03013 family PEP-CTERM/XrtA system glycosyltransferase [Candidatus Berkiella cookevillensis]|uniref:TIGR03013 family PEP-CTERM/XrtA system glycosyltransferase n=1 Tax=Candidatus Berkiella cookevillensis TaxID=437022 RepID=A0A0Q9YP66_9GAMM|nr:TIGR03013 family XrtA/PEP-CTERM system glycosyltransferase [Candidatus Berkiella cookevillensis]MCS5709148.1 TIGR03013 family PEP-CTERM/XrtA system glycosyltransferase [Candidatus Berkiella cookevillensis]